MSASINGDGTVSKNGGTVTDLMSGLVKAWGNLNGTGTIALRDSFNVSSVDDNGVGDYDLNFTNAFASADHALGGSAGGDSISGRHLGVSSSYALVASAVNLDVDDSGGTAVDTTYVLATVHGDLA